MSEGERDEKYAANLIEGLKGQARNGGTTRPIEPSEVTSETSGGPYWKKDMWERYCARVVNALVRDCGYSQTEAEELVRKNSQEAKTWE